MNNKTDIVKASDFRSHVDRKVHLGFFLYAFYNNVKFALL